MADISTYKFMHNDFVITIVKRKFKLEGRRDRTYFAFYIHNPNNNAIRAQGSEKGESRTRERAKEIADNLHHYHAK